MKTIDEVATAEKPQDEQVAHLRKRISGLESTINTLRESIGEQREIKQVIANAVEAAEPFKRVPYKAPNKSDKPVIFVQNWSDWHTGELAKADQLEGINAYSWAIEQDRINSLIEKSIAYVDAQRSAYRIDEAFIFGLEDWVNGGLRLESIATNEFPEPVQAVNAGRLLGESILKMCAHFSAVHFVGVGAGNHDRLTPKVQFKDAASNSWSYVVYGVAEAYCRKAGNLEWIQPAGMKHVQKVGRHLFLLEHGHTIRGWSGIPWYGMQRMKGKESLRRMRLMLDQWRDEKKATKREYGFDYWNFGHFHTSCFLEGDTIVNASLSGTNEFDHACGRHAKPGQNAFLVHPTHGLFNFLPFAVA